ncbi:uncharacterized protein MKK02DRAFT_43159 [Dioszegia hungarica]|uniref:Uncharacterized protein n=1 Tax=Dioszegia hungarica TaxID=4972 RepID=A0AA38HE77_9TREE|nr:uncharacterized protein MKK02DRAFT_43159 [Dioszegia hungarica]KAI9637239.1 hypothetical protein MKK02DRAFT_43159 [Dioszegia hungarica]
MPVPPQETQSQLERTSNILGEYMLKGWTLTDLHCDQCNVTPLMREPAAQASAANRARIQFCAQCDGGPAGPSSQARQITPDQPGPLPQLEFPSPIDPHPPIPSSSSPLPRTTSPTAAARTRTSEDISEAISARLLQGYSLLQSNCPNASCKGVPLIGYPRAKDGTRDPRRMCVGCGTGYVSEGQMGGMQPIQPMGRAQAQAVRPVSGSSSRGAPQTQAGPSTGTGLGVSGMGTQAQAVPESPRSKRRRELYETGEAINATLRPPPSDRQTTTSRSTAQEDQDLLSPIDPDLGPSASVDGPAPPPTSTIHTALERVNGSLALTLDRLAASLSAHTADGGQGSEARYFVDVKLHTEAIRDVLECVEMVRRVQ